MRSFTVVTLLCTIATVLSTQDCNPTYDTPSAGPCFADCNEKAGKTFFSDWTNDKSSPQFLKSLTLMCQKGTSDYTSFMTKAGICMVSCANPELFNAEFAGACAWWQAHKDDTCAAESTTSKTLAITTSPTTTFTESISTTLKSSASTTTTTSIQNESTTSSAVIPNETTTSSSVPSASVNSASSSAISSAVSSSIVPSSIVSSAASTALNISSASQVPSASITAGSNQTPNDANKLNKAGATTILAAAVVYLLI
ncbi:hypothetical protein G6F64_000906 [Rhizopus arrhizus]|uniref:Secreted protein n=1 Tax=Rhizopus oryzae TaxID=64495 RepID=A0A9P6XJ28_RHIOR|nr:hypothetical protein G6F64_000906 [Rhizopus arrhizus]